MYDGFINNIKVSLKRILNATILRHFGWLLDSFSTNRPSLSTFGLIYSALRPCRVIGRVVELNTVLI